MVGDAACVPRPHTAASTSKAVANARTLGAASGRHQLDIDAALREWEPMQLNLASEPDPRSNTYESISHRNLFRPDLPWCYILRGLPTKRDAYIIPFSVVGIPRPSTTITERTRESPRQETKVRTPTRKKAAKSRARFGFWPIFGRQSRIFPRSDTDCKFAGFTPSVVRIHSYPRLLRSHSSSFEAAWRMTHSTQPLRTFAFRATQKRCEQCQYCLKDSRTPSTESHSTRLGITKLIT